MSIKASTLAICLGTFALAAAAGDKTIYDARLAGLGKGKAKFQTSMSNGGQAELEVEGENLPRNTVFSVDVASGKVVAQVRTDSFGRFALARRYGPRGIPQIKAGDTVVVHQGQNVALRGTFVLRVR